MKKTIGTRRISLEKAVLLQKRNITAVPGWKTCFRCMLNIDKEITNDDNDTNLTVAELTNLDDSLNNKEVLNSSLKIVGI